MGLSKLGYKFNIDKLNLMLFVSMYVPTHKGMFSTSDSISVLQMGMGHGHPEQGHHYASMYLPDHMTTPMTIQ